jgi:hypothetical protein
LISAFPCAPTQFPIRNREIRSQLQLPQKAAARGSEGRLEVEAEPVGLFGFRW